MGHLTEVSEGRGMKRGACAVGPHVCSSHTVTARLPGKANCESKEQSNVYKRATLMASGSSGEGGGPSGENPAGSSDAEQLRRTITSLVREALASERWDRETDGEGTANPSAGMSLATSPSSLG